MTVSRLVSVALGVLAAGAVAAAVFSGPIAHRFHGHVEGHEATRALAVDEVAGFTKLGFTNDYLVIVNVLPGEVMSSMEEMATGHPTVEEMEMHDEGSDVAPGARHVEAHLYDRDTGMPITDLVPVIEVLDGRTGEVTVIQSVLMQDAVVGGADIHFGDNIVIDANSTLTITVRLGQGEDVVVDGRLG